MARGELGIEAALSRARILDGTSFIDRYRVFKDRVLSTEYTMTMAGFPGGNDHGPGHIKRVLAYLDKLLSPRPLKHLNEYELFLSMMGVLYHDIGILRGRDGHAEKGAQLLEAEGGSYIFEESDLVVLPHIVRSHTSSSRIEDVPDFQPIRGYDVDPRKVAALVRLADELDEDLRRADPILQSRLELPEKSEFYWRFNQRVRGVSVEATTRDLIFNVAFKDDDVGLTETGVKSSFIRLCLEKIAKANRERRYCNGFLPEELRVRSTVILLQPMQKIAFRGARVHLDEDIKPESLDHALPQQVLELCLGKAGKTRHSNRKKPLQTNESEVEVPDLIVNGFKLFYYRLRKQWTVKALEHASGVSAKTINTLEQVKRRVEAPFCFKRASADTVKRLEKALTCGRTLEAGRSDDLLAKYVAFYQVNRESRWELGKGRARGVELETKAVVFDFGGTLTKSTSKYSTWERMWRKVGYTVQDAGVLHRQFSEGIISHKEWCDATCSQLRARNFSHADLKELIAEIQPIDDLLDCLSRIHARGIQLFIVSGSVREIIASVLGSAYSLFTQIRANEIVFDERKIIREIRGHNFDFRGKDRFIRNVARDEVRCEPHQILFVGNSYNDSWASKSGARTLCVNPSNVDHTNTKVWHDCIMEMRSLREIEPFIVGM